MNEREHQRKPPFQNTFRDVLGLAIFPFCFGVIYSLIALFLLVRKGSTIFQPPYLLPANQRIVVVTVSLGALAILSFGCFLLLWFAGLWRASLRGEPPVAVRHRTRQHEGEPHAIPDTSKSAPRPTRRAALAAWAWREMRLPGWMAGIVCVAYLLSILSGLVSFSTAFLVAAEADMTRTSFVQRELTLNAGETVTFVNPASGISQLLCPGAHDECPPRLADASAPPQLAHGLRLLPGQRVSVVFETPGDEQIISVTTPGMAITIHVDSSD